MAFIPSHQELARHPKTRKVARLLGVSLPTALGHLHLLWYWAMDYARDGDLAPYAAEDIADGAGYEGLPDRFLAALIECGVGERPGFIERTATGTLALHDWHEYGGKLHAEREANARRNRETRRATAAERDTDAISHPLDTRDALVLPTADAHADADTDADAAADAPVFPAAVATVPDDLPVARIGHTDGTRAPHVRHTDATRMPQEERRLEEMRREETTREERGGGTARGGAPRPGPGSGPPPATAQGAGGRFCPQYPALPPERLAREAAAIGTDADTFAAILPQWADARLGSGKRAADWHADCRKFARSFLEHARRDAARHGPAPGNPHGNGNRYGPRAVSRAASTDKYTLTAIGGSLGILDTLVAGRTPDD